MKTVFVIFSIFAIILLMSFQLKSGKDSKENDNGIQFHQSTWKEVLDLAKKENKVIFLDIYASWCGPCKLLKSKTFSNQEVGDFYNENFINVALDGEKGEGITLADKYNVRAYPTLLFIHPDGTIKHYATGYHDAKQFIDLGQKVIKK